MKSLATQLPVSYLSRARHEMVDTTSQVLCEPEAATLQAYNDVDHCGMYIFNCIQEHSVIICDYIPI